MLGGAVGAYPLFEAHVLIHSQVFSRDGLASLQHFKRLQNSG